MNKNKIIEMYCPRCKTIKAPKQQIMIKPEGMVVETVKPKLCPTATLAYKDTLREYYGNMG